MSFRQRIVKSFWQQHMNSTNVIPWTGCERGQNTEYKMTKQAYFKLALTRGSSQSRPQYCGACIPSPWRFPAVWWKSHPLETERNHTDTWTKNYIFIFWTGNFFISKWDIFHLEINSSHNDGGHESTTTIWVMNHLRTPTIQFMFLILEQTHTKTKNTHFGWYKGCVEFKL